MPDLYLSEAQTQLDALLNAPNPPSSQELLNLAKQVDVSQPQGTTLILYSGGIHDAATGAAGANGSFGHIVNGQGALVQRARCCATLTHGGGAGRNWRLSKLSP
jgi:hypothetical protein